MYIIIAKFRAIERTRKLASLAIIYTYILYIAKIQAIERTRKLALLAITYHNYNFITFGSGSYIPRQKLVYFLVLKVVAMLLPKVHIR